MKFHVHLIDNAKGDIRAILRWLESRSPAGAEAWYRKWLDALETMRERADSLGLAPESDVHPEPIRQILFKTKRGRFYRALFAVRELEVFVLHVRGTGQDLIQSKQKN